MEINMREVFVEGAIYKVKGSLSEYPLPLQLKYKNDLNMAQKYHPEIINFEIIDGQYEEYNGIKGEISVDTRCAMLIYEKEDKESFINALSIERLFYATNKFVAIDLNHTHNDEMSKSDFIVDIGLITEDELDQEKVQIDDSYVGLITSINKDDLSVNIEFQVDLSAQFHSSIEIREITIPLSRILTSKYLSLKIANDKGMQNFI